MIVAFKPRLWKGGVRGCIHLGVQLNTHASFLAKENSEIRGTMVHVSNRYEMRLYTDIQHSL